MCGCRMSATTVSGWTNPAAAALSAGTTNGIVNIKSGGQIKYVGIPNGTAVEVYETNTATGVVYKVDTALTTSSMTTSTDNSVTWGSAPSAAVSQSTRADASYHFADRCHPSRGALCADARRRPASGLLLPPPQGQGRRLISF